MITETAVALPAACQDGTCFADELMLLRLEADAVQATQKLTLVR